MQTLSHYFLTSCVTTEHSAISLILIFVSKFFFPFTYRIFSLFLFRSLIITCLAVSLFPFVLIFYDLCQVFCSDQKILLLLIFLAHVSFFFTPFTIIRQMLDILDISSISQQMRQPFSPSAVKRLLIIETSTTADGRM